MAGDCVRVSKLMNAHACAVKVGEHDIRPPGYDNTHFSIAAPVRV